MTIKKYCSLLGRVVLAGALLLGAYVGLREASRTGEQERLARQQRIESQKTTLRGKVLDRQFYSGNFIDLATFTLAIGGKRIKFTQESIFDGDTKRYGYTVPYSILSRLNDTVYPNANVEVLALDEGRREYTGLDAKVINP